MHRVTDIYGPIPYSKMMDNDNSGEDLAVPYDSQEQVYTQMLKELEEADKVLEETKTCRPRLSANWKTCITVTFPNGVSLYIPCNFALPCV